MTGGGTTRTVTRCRWTRARNPSRSKRDMVTTVAPHTSGSASVAVNPMTWKNGATASTVSRAIRRSPRLICRTVVTTRLAWVSMTPLGSPVVPLE
jgi:hypothetical protein